MNEEKLMTSDIIYDYVRNNVDALIYDANQKLLGYLIGFTLSGTVSRFLVLAVSSEASVIYANIKFEHAERIFGPFRIFVDRPDKKTQVCIPDMKKCYFINGEPVYNHIK